MEQYKMNDTIDKEPLDTRLKAAARAIRFAGMGVLPSYGRTTAALEAVLEARLAEPSVMQLCEVAEVTLRNMTRSVLPTEAFCKAAAKEVDTVANVFAQRPSDTPPGDRPRG
jgi:hypothetical protein